MESKPLEAPSAIPERVTSDVPKTKPAQNPYKVDFGKKLAERNRLAREAKKQAEGTFQVFFKMLYIHDDDTNTRDYP